MFRGYALKTSRDLELKRDGRKTEAGRQKNDFKINQNHNIESNLWQHARLKCLRVTESYNVFSWITFRNAVD